MVRLSSKGLSLDIETEASEPFRVLPFAAKSRFSLDRQASFRKLKAPACQSQCPPMTGPPLASSADEMQLREQQAALEVAPILPSFLGERNGKFCSDVRSTSKSLRGSARVCDGELFFQSLYCISWHRPPCCALKTSANQAGPHPQPVMLPAILSFVSMLCGICAGVPVSPPPRQRSHSTLFEAAPNVTDIVNCLSNKTRYTISLEETEIFIQLAFYSRKTEGMVDTAVFDCVLQLGMLSVAFQIVPLDDLRLTIEKQSGASVTVPLDFVPQDLLGEGTRFGTAVNSTRQCYTFSTVTRLLSRSANSACSASRPPAVCIEQISCLSDLSAIALSFSPGLRSSRPTPLSTHALNRRAVMSWSRLQSQFHSDTVLCLFRRTL